MRKLEGKVALVTGSGRGIGRAIALKLASEGASVVVNDLDAAPGDAVANEIKAAGGRAMAVNGSVSEAGFADRFVGAGLESFGGLDILFNNAGAGGARETIDAISPEDWDRTQALLLRSVALGIRYAAPLMAKRGGGAIINTSSVSALGSGYAPTAYSTAKAGVLHLTKMAAADLARHHIRVNAVVPGFIATNIFAASLGIEGEKRDMANAAIAGMAGQAQPIQRTGRSEDIAAAVAFLASDDASFVTGTHILVDGGLTIGPRHSWDPNMPSLFAALEHLTA